MYTHNEKLWPKDSEKTLSPFRDMKEEGDENNAATIKINCIKSNLLKGSQPMFIANHLKL